MLIVVDNMAGTYPKVTSDLSLIKRFRMKISLDNDSAGENIVLCRNCNLRDSTLKGSLFSP